jgi:hypothetical protein
MAGEGMVISFIPLPDSSVVDGKNFSDILATTAAFGLKGEKVRACHHGDLRRQRAAFSRQQYMDQKWFIRHCC